METLTYKNFTGKYKFYSDDNMFFGRLINIGKDMILFQGTTIDELKADFRNAVLDYIDALQSRK